MNFEQSSGCEIIPASWHKAGEVTVVVVTGVEVDVVVTGVEVEVKVVVVTGVEVDGESVDEETELVSVVVELEVSVVDGSSEELDSGDLAVVEVEDTWEVVVVGASVDVDDSPVVGAEKKYEMYVRNELKFIQKAETYFIWQLYLCVCTDNRTLFLNLISLIIHLPSVEVVVVVVVVVTVSCFPKASFIALSNG